MVQGGPQMEARIEKSGSIMEILEADCNAKRMYHLHKAFQQLFPPPSHIRSAKHVFSTA